MWPELLPLVVLAPFLVAMAYSDLKRMRISNRLVFAMIAVFMLVAPFTLGPMDIAWRVFAASVVFVIATIGFSFGILAGGDVKGLTALVLFVPNALLATFAFVFSASMLVGIAGVLLLRQGFGKPGTSWAALAEGQGFPMGVSIALAGLVLPLVVLI